MSSRSRSYFTRALLSIFVAAVACMSPCISVQWSIKIIHTNNDNVYALNIILFNYLKHFLDELEDFLSNGD